MSLQTHRNHSPIEEGFKPLPPAVWTIMGAITGLAMAEFLGGVVGGTLGFLIGTVRQLKRRLDALEGTVTDTASTSAALPISVAPPAPTTGPTSTPTPDPSSTPKDPEIVENKSPPHPAPKVIPTPLPPEVPWTPEPVGSPSPPSGVARLIDTVQQRVVGFFTTGNVVAKIGGVILFFGLAFLVRYAAQQFNFPIELRLTGVGLAGLALLGSGWRLRHRPDAYGLILQGVGVAVLYLTMFAAARLYEVVPLLAALGFMVMLVAATCVLAVRQNSQALAVLALSGGFLAPVLTSTGSGNHVALFSYYALLNTGIFAMAWFRAWRGLNWLGFVFTFSIGTLWGLEYYTPEHFATSQPFLIIFFVFYVAVSLLFTRRHASGWRGVVDGSLIFGTPTVAFALQAALVRDLPFGLAYSALAVAVVYIGLTSWLYRQGALETLLGQSFLALGIVFASLTLPFAFDNQQWTAAAWALEGAGLVWVGARQGRLLPRVFGSLLQMAAPLAYIASAVGVSGLAGNRHFLESDVIAITAMAVAAFFSAYVLSTPNARIHAVERLLQWPFLAWGVLTWLFGGVIELDTHLSGDLRFNALVLFIAVSSAGLTRLAVWRRWPEARTPGWLLLPTSALMLIWLANDVSQEGPLSHLGWLAWPICLAVIIWQLRVNERASLPPRLPRLLATATHASTLLMLVMLAAWSVSGAITLNNPLWSLVVWGLVPAVIAVAVQRLAPTPRWPVGAHLEAYVGAGLAPMMMMLLFWTVGSNSYSGNAAPLPSLPLLNPLDLTQAFVLLTLADWCRRQAAFRLAGYRHLALIGVAATAFVWLTATTARFVHWTFGVPYHVEAMVPSPIFQAALSILWTVLAIAAMILGSRRPSRPLWIIGATLLGLVIIKLMVIDLSASGTMARIVSFLSVGGLTLLVGYLAPLPPKKTADALADEGVPQ